MTAEVCPDMVRGFETESCFILSLICPSAALLENPALYPYQNNDRDEFREALRDGNLESALESIVFSDIVPEGYHRLFHMDADDNFRFKVKLPTENVCYVSPV